MTTISNPPIWQQNRAYSARLDRTIVDLLFTEGVVDIPGGDFEIAETSPTSYSVSVNTGRALVAGDDVSQQGVYLIVNEAVLNLPMLPPPTGADDRIDLVVLQVNDPVAGSLRTPANEAEVVVVQGTPAPSPVAPSIPDTAIPLAEIYVAVGATSILNADITDRRLPSSNNDYSVVVVVPHGSNAATVRPATAASVYWQGDVRPDNAVDGDVWFDTSDAYRDDLATSYDPFSTPANYVVAYSANPQYVLREYGYESYWIPASYDLTDAFGYVQNIFSNPNYWYEFYTDTQYTVGAPGTSENGVAFCSKGVAAYEAWDNTGGGGTSGTQKFAIPSRTFSAAASYLVGVDWRSNKGFCWDGAAGYVCQTINTPRSFTKWALPTETTSTPAATLTHTSLVANDQLMFYRPSSNQFGIVVGRSTVSPNHWLWNAVSDTRINLAATPYELSGRSLDAVRTSYFGRDGATTAVQYTLLTFTWAVSPFTNRNMNRQFSGIPTNGSTIGGGVGDGRNFGLATNQGGSYTTLFNFVTNTWSNYPDLYAAATTAGCWSTS